MRRGTSVEGVKEPGERGVFGAAAGEPDVGVGRGMTVAILEILCGTVGKLRIFVELALEGAGAGGVGDVNRTGQTRVTLPARLQRRQLHQPFRRGRSARRKRCTPSWSSLERWMRCRRHAAWRSPETPVRCARRRPRCSFLAIVWVAGPFILA